MKIASLILMLFIGFQANCQSRFNSADLRKMKWLEGTWKGIANGEPFYEAWKFVNDSVMVNFGIDVKNGDTLIEESAPMILSRGEIWMGQTIRWKASRLVGNEIVLKNDTAKFSNTIIWMHTSDDHWFTILEHPGSTSYYDMIRDQALDKKLEVWITEMRRKKDQ
jgi:hypothetical protein